MKKICLLFSLLAFISPGLFSQVKVNLNDISCKKIADPKDRNMFGLRIPCGLTVTSDGPCRSCFCSHAHRAYAGY